MEELNVNLPSDGEGDAQSTPCVTTRVTVDAALQKRISRRARAALLCIMVVGVAALVAYVVLFVLAEEGAIVVADDFWLDLLLWGGAVFFALGLVYFISSGRANKKQLSLAFVNEYLFYPDQVVINDYRAGDLVSTARLRYSDFEKIRENKEFFLLYPNRVTVYPVDKLLLSEEERVRLRNVLFPGR